MFFINEPITAIPTTFRAVGAVFVLILSMVPVPDMVVGHRHEQVAFYTALIRYTPE